MKEQAYTSDNIKVLSDFEHVRLRTSVYLGSVNPTLYNIPLFLNNKFEIKPIIFAPAVFKCVGELIDNANDEMLQLKSSTKLIKIQAKSELGHYTISDNGRGVPIDIHETGKYTPEVVFGSLRSGRNFDDSQKQVGVIGTLGIGSSITNACSNLFEVTINRENKKYYQKFTNGASEITKPKITNNIANTGTQVSIQLDPTVFKHISIPDEMMHNRAIEIAMTSPGVTVEYNGHKYKFKKGMADLIPTVANKKPYFCFTIDENNIQGQIYVILDAHDSQDEQMFTWVNNSLLFDGGKCNTQFFNVLFDQVTEHLKKDAKKTKTEITRNDIRQGLLVLADIKIKNPEYDSPAKTRLTGPDTRKDMTSAVDGQWKQFKKIADKWMQNILLRAQERHHKTENKKATADHQKNLSKRVEGLLDATNRDRSTCQLLITEGLSAKAGICEVRDPATTAAFALTGKINNVYGCTPAQILKMGKVTDMLLAIGLVPGKRAIRSELKFGRVAVTSDSDFDGDDIFTLLVNLFYNMWPELFDPKYPPFIYRLVAPNIVVSKKDQRIHFTTRADFEKEKSKYNSWTVEYMKGLGSMSKVDWQIILSGNSDCFLPIIDDGNFKPTLQLLFGDDAEARKQWLTK